MLLNQKTHTLQNCCNQETDDPNHRDFTRNKTTARSQTTLKESNLGLKKIQSFNRPVILGLNPKRHDNRLKPLDQGALKFARDKKNSRNDFKEGEKSYQADDHQ